MTVLGCVCSLTLHSRRIHCQTDAVYELIFFPCRPGLPVLLSIFLLRASLPSCFRSSFSFSSVYPFSALSYVCVRPLLTTCPYQGRLSNVILKAFATRCFRNVFVLDLVVACHSATSSYRSPELVFLVASF